MAGGSFSVRIQHDAREVEKMLRGLKNGANKVLVRAINKTATPVKRVALRSMAKDLRLTQKSVAKSVKLDRATWRLKRATITVTGRRIPIIDFGARQVKKGVTYKGRGGGRKLIPGAYIATMESKGVFKRIGRERGPNRELLGPSPQYVFVRHHIRKAMDAKASTEWDKHIRHELKYFLSKI